MKTSKRHHDRATEGCREGRRPSAQARARAATAQAEATLLRVMRPF